MAAAPGAKLRWLKFTSGSNIDYVGSSKPNNGWINSYGQAWYDANPAGQGGLPNRPKLISFKTNKGTLQYLKARKPHGWCASLEGSDITVSNANIDSVSTSSKFPFNTDGFSIGGPRITITNSSKSNRCVLNSLRLSSA